MKCYILGNGESKAKTPNDKTPIIGLTYISEFKDPDYLMVCDIPGRFSEDKIYNILHSQGELYSCFEDWKELRQCNVVEMEPNKMMWDKIGYSVPRSNNSAIPAIGLAYNLGFKEIILHGVDFDNHPLLNKPHQLNQIKEHFNWIKDLLKEKGCSLYLGSNHGILKEILPIYVK